MNFTRYDPIGTSDKVQNVIALRFSFIIHTQRDGSDFIPFTSDAGVNKCLGAENKYQISPFRPMERIRSHREAVGKYN